ncbi:NADH-quinone oxidoreductase subunit C [Streptomyces sp. NPDC023838]|uniref:NADH-quinone oxidoreductase subunit C n=1 Tax=Streptomyces sp. NPDC023838 TaxID=3154325 RepID=UPI0033FC8B14
MTAYDRLPDAVTEIFGEEATAEEAYGLLTVDVPAGSWIAALEIARDQLGCTYFDWLSAVDEPGTGFRVCAHVVSLGSLRSSERPESPESPGSPEGRRVRRLLVRTTVPHTAPVLASAVDVYAGAAWHERETHEMFGVEFEGHPNLIPLLLPEGFEGHPLRKDFVLAARVAKAWPGAKEPGESEHGGPKRRQMLPPGVPDPNEWGPLKGQLPPAPTRTPRAAGDRPARRTRTVTEGSASQPTPGTEAPARPVRRTRTASEGSASQTSPEAAPPEAPARPVRRTRTASEGSASQTSAEAATSEAPAARPVRRTRTASEGSASQTSPEAAAPPRTRSTDAPWNNPRPAFDDAPETPAAPERTESTPAAEAESEPRAGAKSGAESKSGAGAGAKSEPRPELKSGADPEPEPEPNPKPDPEPDPETDTPAGGEPA